ncbi:MAG: DUF4870 domain-containing protein [bacterium]
MNEEQLNQGQPQQPGPMPPQPPPPASGDDSQHKTIAILGYILPFLFFIPLLSEEAKGNRFAKYHANQQLNLLLWWVVGSVLASMLMFIFIGALLYPIVCIGGVVFMIMGIINASNGETKPLPLIGKIELLK